MPIVSPQHKPGITLLQLRPFGLSVVLCLLRTYIHEEVHIGMQPASVLTYGPQGVVLPCT